VGIFDKELLSWPLFKHLAIFSLFHSVAFLYVLNKIKVCRANFPNFIWVYIATTLTFNLAYSCTVFKGTSYYIEAPVFVLFVIVVFIFDRENVVFKRSLFNFFLLLAGFCFTWRAGIQLICLVKEALVLSRDWSFQGEHNFSLETIGTIFYIILCVICFNATVNKRSLSPGS
jgi:hypothetical protein